MRVAMYYKNSDVRLEERPVPKIGKGELLVKVMASGICGSDVMEWYRIKKAPRVLGHEIAGEIAEVGGAVKKFKKGDRVFVSHHVSCGKCRYCLDGHESACDTLRATNFDPGGFSEYLRVPEVNVEKGTYLLPDEMSYEDGTFIEPVGCVVRGQRFARVQKGQTVLVVGSGISGLMHVQLAKLNGARKVIATDIIRYRLDAAKRLGADEVIDAKDDVPGRLLELNNGLPADRVIVCTGALPAIDQALKSVDRGGIVLFFAPTEPGVNIPVPLWDIWTNEVSVTTSYAANHSDIIAAIELIRSSKFKTKEMVTHRLGLADAGKGFRLVAEAKDSIKVIIEPQR